MEQSEIEILVNELETRTERLRSLYDQYFMGIERMPPAVPHKDVERRIQTLRREQIRNTGLRFKFQMILQRYNTYQSYWLRISRQIEDGTYKRDVIRAKRKAAEREARESLAPASIDITQDLDELEEVPNDEAPTAAKPAHVELKLDEIDSLDALLDEENPTNVLPTAPAAKPAAPKPPVPKPPVPAPKAAPAAKPAVPAPPPSAPAVVARPAALPSAGGARPQWKKVSAPTAGVSIPIAEPAKQGPLPAKAEPKPEPRPEPAKPAAAAAEKPRPARPEPPKPRAPLGPDDLSDARVRQIYAEYVRTKRSQNESTASLNYESMAKSIRDSSEKLREKHGGKKVDFEVQVKDGKTILKPVVKG